MRAKNNSLGRIGGRISCALAFALCLALVFTALFPGSALRAEAESAGNQTGGKVSYIKFDKGPESGKESTYEEGDFILDETNNSIVLDLGEVQEVNYVLLRDSDEYARLAAEFLLLYVSEDDLTYTRVPSFKLFHEGTDWYLYDFSVQARYVKVHCCHYDSEETSFEGPLQSMMEAGKDTVFLDGGGAFKKTSNVAVKNESEQDVTDGIFRISLKDIKADASNGYRDLRLVLMPKEGQGKEQEQGEQGQNQEERLLYHYVDGEELVARVPFVAAGDSVEVKVLSGNPSARDIANPEGVYEAVYGSKEVWRMGSSDPNEVRWLTALPDGTVVGFSSTNAPNVAFSYDDGGNWTEKVKIEEGKGLINSDGGMFYGEKSGLLIMQGHLSDKGNYTTGVLVSEDMGQTWKSAGVVKNKDGSPQKQHRVLSYSNGIELSTWDGDGPNVDFVMSVHLMMDGTGTCALCPAYSTDNGKNWYFTDTEIYMEDVEGMEKFANGNEVGLSEGSIAELSDGTLLLLARFQYDQAFHLMRAVSKDCGITWTDARESNIYAVNTQPMLYPYDGDILLLWPGNNALGAASYLRAPLNVALSTDDGENFRGIQDLFSKTYIQRLGSASNHLVTNPGVALDRKNDVLLTTFTDLQGMIQDRAGWAVRVRDFDDFLKKTKGAYDSFENGPAGTEGWIVAGNPLTDAEASQGSRSMKLSRGGMATRSIPYLQDGVVSLMLYAPKGTEKFTVDLQAAYNNVPDRRSSPTTLYIKEGKLYTAEADGSEKDTGLSLQQGWNRVDLSLALSGDSKEASVSLNGSEPVAAGVNAAVGDYVCFVVLSAGDVVYVDEFMINAAQSLAAFVQQTAGNLWIIVAVVALAVVVCAAVVVLCLRKKKKAKKA